MLPRYFVTRQDAPTPLPAVDPLLLSHLVDAFGLGGRQRSARPAVAARDLTGALHVLAEDDGAGLPPTLRAALAHHEVTRGAPPRALDVEELWLFDLQLVEQPPDTPGVNDPVYLYGRLTGPFPPGTVAPVAVEGQLTVTRADLLAGLVDELEHALRTDQGRCLHALVPGDRAEEIVAGRGVVLAWPLSPLDVDATAGNEALVVTILFDLLSALQADMRAARHDHPLVHTALPVPDRQAVEAQLQRDGYVITGDMAVKRKEGLLSSVLGDRERKALPPQGTLLAYADLARRTLQGLPGWPDPRYKALRERVRPPTPRAAPQRPPPVTPRPSGTLPPPPRPADAPPDWMQDFLRAHEQGPKPARITRVAAPAGPAAAPTRAAPSQAATARTQKPDWMTDFEE